MSGLQITVEALAVITTWVEPNHGGLNFFPMAKDKKLHPDYLVAANRMVERVLAEEVMFMP